MLQPDDFTTENPPVASGFIEVPSDWNGFDVNGKKIAGDGYATYRLKILLGRDERKDGVQVPRYGGGLFRVCKRKVI